MRGTIAADFAVSFGTTPIGVGVFKHYWLEIAVDAGVLEKNGLPKTILRQIRYS